MESPSKYASFIKMNRDLLDCYAQSMNPLVYKHMSAAEQRDFCYVERVKLEDALMRGKIDSSDFFKQ